MRLSDTQLEALQNAAAGKLYARRWSRWQKTCTSLISRGLICPVGYDGYGQSYEITEAGRAEYLSRYACSYPGCGKPTAYLQHADGGPGWGWRHLDPADEANSHVGYPMAREPQAGGAS